MKIYTMAAWFFCFYKEKKLKISAMVGTCRLDDVLINVRKELGLN